jgi:molecular chaperone Hsp33
MADQIKRWVLKDSQVRGAIVSLDHSWTQVAARHDDAPDNVLSHLGQMTAAGLLLASSIKFDGYLTLQIHGAGPIALMVADCEASGAYRATFRAREGHFVDPKAPLVELVNQDNLGRFAVTLSPRDKHQQPYQGIVALDSPQLSVILENYMARSEQLETRLWLAADKFRAVGLLMQKMPLEGGKEGSTQDADAWNRMCLLGNTLTPSEMLGLMQDDLMHRLFWEEPLLLNDQHACEFRCQCSRQKVASMLQMIGKTEVDSILIEQGAVSVNCEYCNLKYAFDSVDAASLFNADGTPLNIIEQPEAPKSVQ